MARNVFYSFHYELDHWRVQQVKKMGALEGQPILSGNAWEEVKAGGEKAIKKWIDEKMVNKSCIVVLIGSKTASRKWVEYEIRKAWNDGKGVVGVYIHGLLDQNGKTSTKGANPFWLIKMTDGTTMASKVKAHDPVGSSSKAIYAYIDNNIEKWVEAAIDTRKK